MSSAEPEDEPSEVDDELVAAATRFDEWLTGRGWTFDTEFSAEGLASWFYGPSATEFDEENLEPVTRIWFTIVGADDDFPDRVGAVLVGAGADDRAVYSVSPDAIFDHIDAIEAYRPGGRLPVLN